MKKQAKHFLHIGTVTVITDTTTGSQTFICPPEMTGHKLEKWSIENKLLLREARENATGIKAPVKQPVKSKKKKAGQPFGKNISPVILITSFPATEKALAARRKKRFIKKEEGLYFDTVTGHQIFQHMTAKEYGISVWKVYDDESGKELETGKLNTCKKFLVNLKSK